MASLGLIQHDVVSAKWDGSLVAIGSFLLLTFITLNPDWLVIEAAGLGFVIYY